MTYTYQNQRHSNNEVKEVEDSSSSQEESSSSSTSLSNNDGNNSMIPIIIQHQNNRFSLSVSKFQTVADLKQSVLQKVQTTTKQHHNDYYVRLIAAGRLLAPDDAKINSFNIANQQILHAVIVEGTNHRGMQAAMANTTTTNHPRTRRVGEEEESSSSSLEEDLYDVDSDDDDEEEDDAVEDVERGHRRATTTSSMLRRNRIPLGFDRLRITAGLRRADVLAIRISFNPQLDRWLETHPEFAYLHETDVLRRRRLQEEAWMLSQGPASEFVLNLGGRSNNNTTNTNNNNNLRWTTAGTTAAAAWRNTNNNPNLNQLNSLSSTTVGTDRDFVWGFVLGFFVGFLMLLWVWMPTVPHKQKLGIITGYSFHLGLGMLRSNRGEDDGHATTDTFGDDTTLLS